MAEFTESDRSQTASVSGLIVGGAFGLFMGFGAVFWLFDPKAMQLPGWGDLAFFVAAMLGSVFSATLGSFLGGWIGDFVRARRPSRGAIS